jgi:hypothetical protein
MPENNSFENPQLDEIRELERQLAEKKAAMNIESGMERMEIRPETGRENFSETPVQAPVPSVSQAAVADKIDKRKEIEQDAKSIAMMDETRKIETLIAIALEKGIMHSIEVANNLQDPYILDTLHDKLVGELHDRLVSEKKLKEV